jgi:hypothetical protein
LLQYIIPHARHGENAVGEPSVPHLTPLLRRCDCFVYAG